ncbi:hypothetical protein CDL15_Pgr020944 [Punica granatum]|uniref:Uncharacterized protein n=1 Tax=Punica granatum TaxID=22663 RepID=A0A218WSE3_PUNGR|nr:hypothetical protein CDL15_Pgr020944 [Punica granatum]
MAEEYRVDISEGSQSTGPGTFSAAPDVCSTTSDSRRRTSGVFRRPFDASPAPDVFRGAPPTSLTDVVHLRRPCSHRSTRGHSQPISCEHDHQHGGVVRPTQRTEQCILKLHTTFGTRTHGRPDILDSANSSSGKH